MLFTLGPMGQMPSLSRYTIITLGFAVQDGTDIQSVLDRAANEIVDTFPWLAGQVVVEKPVEDSLTSSGIHNIIRFKPHEGKSKFVHIKDCKDLCPSFTELAKFLLHARRQHHLSSIRIFHSVSGRNNQAGGDHAGEPYQRWFIVRILVMLLAVGAPGDISLLSSPSRLTVCTHHCVMDANGNEQLILQFASLCRREKLTDENIRLGNADQKTIVPPPKPGQVLEPLEFYRCPSKLGAPRGIWPPLPSTGLWKTFRFTHVKVARLKAEASLLCSPDSDVKYISSDDAVSTFIWTRIATARSTWLPEDSNTMLYRAVNGRRKLDPPIPAGYMGHSILMWPTKLPIRNVINDELSSTTIKVRRSLMEVNDTHMRSFFHLLQTEKDRTTVNYGAKVNRETDILITSFVAQKLYNTNFGDVLGKPGFHYAYFRPSKDFIRRPDLPDGINLYYIMPATREGDIDLVAGLSQKEFDSLEKDARWKEYAEYIG